MADKQIEDLKRSETHLRSVMRHIDEVRKNCIIIADKLIDTGKPEDFCFARKLIQNAYKHDASKFSGTEWMMLTRDSTEENLKIALRQHHDTNEHHPEHWTTGISGMDDLYIAEMVCDWKARASESGTDMMQWVKEKAFTKYNFNEKSKVFKRIKYFVNLLLDKQLHTIRVND